MKAFSRLAFSLLLAFAAGGVVADEDHERARAWREQGRILPLERILELAQRDHPGRVLEVELDERGGVPVYELELLDHGGTVWELQYDAGNGRRLKERRDD